MFFGFFIFFDVAFGPRFRLHAVLGSIANADKPRLQFS
jgi:hypothetical protein